jgi:serine protease Do
MKYRNPLFGSLFLSFVCLLGAPTLAHDPAESEVVDLVNKMGPSVVAVHVTLENVRMFPGAGPGERQGGGSGFVIDDQGRIATNFHVVAPALDPNQIPEGDLILRPSASIRVSFVDAPDKEVPVKVTGANADYDLALLELENPEDFPEGVSPLKLGNSDTVQPGQTAIAIGAPFGLRSTVTTGVISAVEREQPGLVGIEVPFIQSDAAINPGNSGGPLFNASGEVIGINNAILASPMGPQAFVGVGFAVPVNLLKDSLEGLRAGGLSGVAAAVGEIGERPRLGLTVPMSVEDFPPPVREVLKLPEHGVIVGEVADGSPADRAGLRGTMGAMVVGGRAIPVVSDVIVAAEGEQVERPIHLQQIILDADPGDVIDLTVWRNGEERELDVRLEVVPPEPASSPTSGKARAVSDQASNFPIDSTFIR